MKANRIFSIIAAAALTISVSAQQSAHDNYIGVSFGGGLNTMLYKAANGQQSVGGGFETGLHYARFFNRTVGLGLGFQYSWNNAYALYSFNEVTPGLTHASNPNLTYTLNTAFTDYKERQNVGVLSIPVEVLFRKAFNDRCALIAGVGLSIDLPVHGKYYTKGGTYATTGVFPALGDYTLSNMPEHGFSTYDNPQGAKVKNLAKAGASVIADLGTRVALSDNAGMYIGLYFGYGFTNLLKEELPNEMLLINPQNSAVIDYYGTFDSNETAKANLLRCGLKIAFDFGWNDKPKEAKPEVDLEAERLAAEKAAAEKAEAERLAREEAERLAAEKAAAEKAEAERIAAEKAAAEKAEAERKAAFKRNVEATTVHFDIEGAKLNIPEAEKAIIDELCRVMKEDPSIKIVITGHTDNYGDPEQNLRYFGMRRAEALRDYMVKQGVSADQIRCESKGQTEPVAPNDTRANRALNRRANIRFE